MVDRVSGAIQILAGGLLMSLIALVPAVTVLLPRRRLQMLLLPLIALAAGTLLGGALFHLLPEGYGAVPAPWAGLWLAAGFCVFLVLEQLLQWHHSHRQPQSRSRPMAVLILVGAALHHGLCGLGIASAFLISPAAGAASWLAAAAHELPQALGDYGTLLHCGWSRPRALWVGFAVALIFPVAAVLAWSLAGSLPLPALVLFTAGSFIYVAASDLVPEIKQRSTADETLVGSLGFFSGLLLMLLLAVSNAESFVKL